VTTDDHAEHAGILVVRGLALDDPAGTTPTSPSIHCAVAGGSIGPVCCVESERPHADRVMRVGQCLVRGLVAQPVGLAAWRGGCHG
jgi:hypothetical protein